MRRHMKHVNQPLEKGGEFLMGHAETATYVKTISPTNLLYFTPLTKLMKSVFGIKTKSIDDEL